MNEPIRLKKIAKMKVFEKDNAALLYEEAVSTFEFYAKKLYNLLKQKEQLKEIEVSKLQKGISILELQGNESFIFRLDKEIHHVHLQVMNSRDKMNYRKQELLLINQEVKKYEKIVEKKQTIYNHWLNKVEGELLNEMSLLRFNQRENR